MTVSRQGGDRLLKVNSFKTELLLSAGINFQGDDPYV